MYIHKNFSENQIKNYNVVTSFRAGNVYFLRIESTSYKFYSTMEGRIVWNKVDNNRVKGNLVLSTDHKALTCFEDEHDW